MDIYQYQLGKIHQDQNVSFYGVLWLDDLCMRSRVLIVNWLADIYSLCGGWYNAKLTIFLKVCCDLLCEYVKSCSLYTFT